MTTTMSFDQALQVWQNTKGLRQRVLKGNYMDPKAWRTWLDNEIETIAQCQEPTENNVEQVKRFVDYWMSANTLVVKHEESEDLRHKQNMAALLAEFREMKQAK